MSTHARYPSSLEDSHLNCEPKLAEVAFGGTKTGGGGLELLNRSVEVALVSHSRRQLLVTAP